MKIHSDPFQQCFITRGDRMSVLVFSTIFHYVMYFQILNSLNKQYIHVRGFNRFAENQYSHNSERKYSMQVYMLRNKTVQVFLECYDFRVDWLIVRGIQKVRSFPHFFRSLLYDCQSIPSLCYMLSCTYKSKSGKPS